MSDEQIAELIGAVNRTLRCPCGVLASSPGMFHNRTIDHDCVHHARRSCGQCQAVDRLVAGAEARLYVEAEYGPFTVKTYERSSRSQQSDSVGHATRWDAA